jgi:ribosomal protein L15
MGIGSGRNLIGRSIALALQPAVGFGHLGGIGRAGQNLRHQGVGIKRDGRDQLIQLVGRQGLGRLGGRWRLLGIRRALSHWNQDQRCADQDRQTLLGKLRKAEPGNFRLSGVIQERCQPSCSFLT